MNLHTDFKNEDIKMPIIEEHVLLLKEAKNKEDQEVEQELKLDEDFSKILQELSENLRSEAKGKIKKYEAHGFSKGEIWNELNDFRIIANEAYKDSRFEVITNGKGLRRDLKRIVDTLVNEKFNLTKVRGLGMINLDVNGLKSINDFAGHDEGTEYLKRIVSVLESGNTTKLLRQRGINVFVAANGGDEFIIVLNDDINLAEVKEGNIYINNILRSYQDDIGSIDVSDLIDFSDYKIIEKFNGLKIPKNFKFKASISGGTALFEEILADDRIFNEIENRPGYNNKINQIISNLFEISDERARENKEIFKINLDASKDEAEKFMGIILKRNNEVIAKEKELENLRTKDKQIIIELEEKVTRLEKELVESRK